MGTCGEGERGRVVERWESVMETANTRDKQSVFPLSAPLDRRNKAAKTCQLNTSLSLLSGCSLNGSKWGRWQEGRVSEGDVLSVQTLSVGQRQTRPRCRKSSARFKTGDFVENYDDLFHFGAAAVTNKVRSFSVTTASRK